jgi:hypothetical protein
MCCGTSRTACYLEWYYKGELKWTLISQLAITFDRVQLLSGLVSSECQELRSKDTELVRATLKTSYSDQSQS